MSSGGEKTEKATPKRQKEEWKKGNVAKSKELNTFFNLLSFVFFIYAMDYWFIGKLGDFFDYTLILMENEIEITDFFYLIGKKMTDILLPIAAICLVFITINYLMQIQFFFSLQVIKPNFKKMNPANYFKNLFAMKTIVDILKSILLFIVVGYVVYDNLKDKIDVVSGSILLPWEETLLLLWTIFKSVLLKVTILLGFIGCLDLFYQKFERNRKMKMSKQEVKDEYKKENMDPHVQGKQQSMMMEIVKKDVVNKVPEADFILANPTHYAVAIRYRRELDDVPRVLVKGVDNVALYIRQIAEQHNVPVEVNPPVARELYARVNENELIPEDMFVVVAGIMRKMMEDKKLELK